MVDTRVSINDFKGFFLHHARIQKILLGVPISSRGVSVPVFVCFVCLFDLILYVPSAIFQLNRDGSSWVEPVLS